MHDGDTITVLVNGNHTVKVRFYGIDSPELRQPFGRKAKSFTSMLTFDREVRVVQTGKDTYGRMVGKVYHEPDGIYVNAQIVRAGFAWHFIRYAANDQVLAQSEKEARTYRRGLWADVHTQPPWEFRNQAAHGGK